MEGTLIDAALTQSIWAALSIVLIFYILRKQEARDKTQSDREDKYQGIIMELSQKFHVVEELKEDIKEIKHIVTRP